MGPLEVKSAQLFSKLSTTVETAASFPSWFGKPPDGQECEQTVHPKPRWGRWVPIMVRRAMLFAGLVAVAGFVAITVIGAEMIPGYSHFLHPISQMTEEGADSKACLDPWFILFDFMVVAFASALPGSVSARSDGARLHSARGGALLALAGCLGIIMALWLPMDGSVLTTTVTGSLHELVACAITISSILAILFFGLSFQSNPEWGGFALYSFATFAFASSCSIATVRTISSGIHSQGAWQRMTAGAIVQWVFLVALRALSATTE